MGEAISEAEIMYFHKYMYMYHIVYFIHFLHLEEQVTFNIGMDIIHNIISGVFL